MRKTLTCTDCRVEFTYDHRSGPTRQRCDGCTATRKRKTDAEKRKRWTEQNPERAREQWRRYSRKRLSDPEHLRQKREDHLRRKYGISPAEFAEMLKKQGGGCAICGGDRNGPGLVFHVDHCHKSKRIRGLLCGKCNTAIGLLDDDPTRAEAAAAYLRQ